METAVLFITDGDENADGKGIEYKKVLSAGGYAPQIFVELSETDEIDFRRFLGYFRENVDNLIVIGGDKARFDFKTTVADYFETSLIENQSAKSIATSVAKGKGVSYSENFALIPQTASLIANPKGLYQGFLLKDDDYTVISLPSETDEFTDICDDFLFGYFDGLNEKKRERFFFKYFGEVESIEKTLEDAKSLYKGLTYNIETKYGDSTVRLILSDITGEEKSALLRFIVGSHKDEIYADYRVSLSERLFDLLKLRKLKISTAESFTAGRVVSSVINNSGASSVVYEGIVCYSEDSKKNTLGVKEESLSKYGAVSSTVAYEMAVGLLKKGKCDIAIATTGLAGPIGAENKPVGLCYIAVGSMQGVHTYKFNFSGDRENITETAKNTALFLAIKNIRSIK